MTYNVFGGTLNLAQSVNQFAWVLSPCLCRSPSSVLSHIGWLTHFRSFWRWWGDCGISQDCSHSQSPQCMRCCVWVVCARAWPLLITVVCMCIIWKVLSSYVLDARLGLWVSLEHAFTCVSTTNQAEWRSGATHLLAMWENERTVAWWSHAQGGGPSVI